MCVCMHACVRVCERDRARTCLCVCSTHVQLGAVQKNYVMLDGYMPKCYCAVRGMGCLQLYNAIT